ncbi:aldehyde dehydrogenase [Microbacterium elymi]|uniref:aldehyde dehydrogenase (NAD(+)) n=1 Tax=Microbacterium elymi TaxID=2909587 RepID=A0ABY5NM55_9MICO|nr:aldehyde dehydrogenase [Microbacterium elymi]UUT36218.1 aldehyde dehydrogenase [Microbacterium elymi]
MPEATKIQERVFAGGEYLDSTSAERVTAANPYDRTVIGHAPDGSPEDVDRAVRAAREAFDHGPWPRLSPAERGDWIDRLADELEARAGEIAAFVTDEVGQPISVARFMNGIRPVQHLRYYARLARELMVEQERENVDRDGTTLHLRQPLGVAALIVPWNHPQSSTTLKLGPALAAGCTVVIKPAAESPLDIFALARAAQTIGLPPGVVNIVTGGRETGQALVAHPGVDKVAFTGSSAAGRHIASVAGQRLIPATLELGGKSAAVILDDADLDAVLASLRVASFGNTGQNCNALSRVLVPASRYDRTVEALVDLARDLRVGDPKDPATEIGPLVSQRALTRVTGMVDEARATGATVLAGDTAAPTDGWFYAPRIITGADPDSPIAQHEIFGPVLSVHPYVDVDDAVRIANATRYGLGGAVFSADEGRALEVARRVKTGSIGLNGYRPDLGSPYGGVRDSGVGREFGPEAIENYRESTSVFR